MREGGGTDVVHGWSIMCPAVVRRRRPHNGRLLRAEEDMAEAFWRGENYPLSVRQGIKAEKLSKMGYGDDKNEFMRAMGEIIAFWVLKSLRDLGGRKGGGGKKKKSGGEVEIFTE